jgi:signal transduction histidine kinase
MSLARRMGGALKLDGTPGGGSVAELRLPKAGN